MNIEHTIGSYNMSFASDQGAVIGSEKHFIINGAAGDDKRVLWKNAANFVLHFWQNVPTASAMGLQEMNVRELLKAKNPEFNGGLEAIVEVLSVVPDLDYKACSVDTPFGKPSLLTIWNKTKMGLFANIYCTDLGLDENYSGLNPKQTGRPLSIVGTSFGYVLINLHGPNVPCDSLLGCPLLRNSIQFHLAEYERQYLGGAPATSDKIFIMGDFNDLHNGIKSSRPLLLNKAPFNHSLTDAKTLSCCYNFNSTCPDDLYNKKEEIVVNGELVASPKECFINRGPNLEQNEELKGKARSLGDRGLLSNYKFTGDYCLGSNLKATLSIYRPNANPISMESDHEMVIATFVTAGAGGSRRKTKNGRRTKSKTKRNRRH